MGNSGSRISVAKRDEEVLNKMKLDEESRMKKMELEDEGRRRDAESTKKRMDLEDESRKQETELRNEMKKNYELELKKADLVHQHKIAEFITQMKQTKLQTGKELSLAYMKTITTIIGQNNNLFKAATTLLNQLKDKSLPDSVRGTVEKAVDKAFEVLRCNSLFTLFYCVFQKLLHHIN
jgi:hypothetical protein